MKEEKVSVEHIFRVYDDSSGVFIEVGPDMDALGGIEIRTIGEESKEYFGDFRIMLTPKLARALSNVLMQAAEGKE